MRYEKEPHKFLKKQAINILKASGLNNEEIMLKCKVLYKSKKFFIDVVGLTKPKPTFIECGYITIKKFELFMANKNINFIHLPYLKTKGMCIINSYIYNDNKRDGRVNITGYEEFDIEKEEK